MLRRPGPRKEFIETVCGMSVDHALEDISDVSVGLDVVEFGDLDRAPAACAAVTPENRRFLRPSASALIGRSTGFVSRSIQPSSRNRRRRGKGGSA